MYRITTAGSASNDLATNATAGSTPTAFILVVCVVLLLALAGKLLSAAIRYQLTAIVVVTRLIVSAMRVFLGVLVITLLLLAVAFSGLDESPQAPGPTTTTPGPVAR